jgi:hypothetical protein
VKYLDPAKEPNKWLEYVMLDLLQQNTEESLSQLKDGIRVLANWLEPGLIDVAFHPWIEQYGDLLREQESNQNNDPQQCSLRDQLEPEE